MDTLEIPGYRIRRLIGEGGMASLYLAEQDVFERLVAIKVMSPQLLSDASFGQRFLREARALAALTHPNFVSVYEIGNVNELPFMSMEYVAGGDLKARMRRGISIPEALRIAKDVAAGLDYAGRKHYVHRDIKPKNILLREDLTAVICDFGIARDTDSSTEMTLAGQVIGTPKYMSPEQANGLETDHRSDIYSLGIVIFEMLTGRVPFSGNSAVSTGVMHTTEAIPRLPPEVEVFQQFIDKIMAKSAENRYQTGAAVIEALENLEDENFDLIYSRDEATVLDNRCDTPTHGHLAGLSQVRDPKRRHRLITRIESRQREKLYSQFVVASTAGLTVIALAWGTWYYLSLYDGNSGPTDEPSIQRNVELEEERKHKLEQQIQEAIASQQYGTPEGDNAEYYIQRLLDLDQESKFAKQKTLELYNLYLAQAKTHLQDAQLEYAETALQQAAHIGHALEDKKLKQDYANLTRQLAVAWATLEEKLIQEAAQKEIQERVADFLKQADEQVKAGKIYSPSNDNATHYIAKAIELDSDNDLAVRRTADLADIIATSVAKSIQDNRFQDAAAGIKALDLLKVDTSNVDELRKNLDLATRSERRRKSRQSLAQHGSTAASSTTKRTSKISSESSVAARKMKALSALLDKAATYGSVDTLDSAGIVKVVDIYLEASKLDASNKAVQHRFTVCFEAEPTSHQ